MRLSELSQGDIARITIDAEFQGVDGDGDYEFRGNGLFSTFYVRNEDQLVSVEKVVPPFAAGDIVRSGSGTDYVLIAPVAGQPETFHYFCNGRFFTEGFFPKSSYTVVARVGEGAVAA